MSKLEVNPVNSKVVKKHFIKGVQRKYGKLVMNGSQHAEWYGRFLQVIKGE